MDQQEQAKSYFDVQAHDWQAKAEGRVKEYNIVEARNNAVLDIINRRFPISDFLDVGCGTGQLAIHVAKLGINARGIDFAPEMIRLSEENNRKENTTATFLCASFFDFAHLNNSYDVVSAQGFIEYISLDQLESFLKICGDSLRPGGALALASRNRIFNIVSLNAFTRMETALGTIDHLIEEAVCFQSSDSKKLFSNLATCERIDPQPTSHPGTGIGVDVRYQFSPAELIMRARRYGFVPRTIYPVHFHGLPVGFKNDHPQAHADLAEYAGKFSARDYRFVPYCSSYILDLRKPL
jgi:2-polyprenyl-3-methyl-5-hydroxy-6-metoxy-1,4-benzoquinol methylase